MPILTTSDNVRIAYEVFGPYKGTPFILVHGFASTYMTNWIQTNWVNLLVEQGMRVIVFDNRGHGGSDKPTSIESYAMERMVQDIIELLDLLEIPKAFIMGYSMGGMMTLMAAAIHPDRWLKGIAGGVGANLLERVSDMRLVIQAFHADPETCARLVAENAFIKMFYDFALNNQQDLYALGTCLAAIPRPFPFETLPPIRIPMLFILGDQDTHTGPADGLLPFVPHAQLIYVPGRDHMKAVGDKFYKESVLKFIQAPTT